MNAGTRHLLVTALLGLLPLTAAAHRPWGESSQGWHGGQMHQGGPMHHGPEGSRGPMHQGGGQEHFLRGLDLTEAQRDKIFELRHAQEPVLREKRKAAAKAREELRNLGRAESFDAAKAKVVADAHGKAVSEMMLLKAQLHAQVRAVLTAEQKKRLDERLSGKGGPMGGRGMGWSGERPMGQRG